MVFQISTVNTVRSVSGRKNPIAIFSQVPNTDYFTRVAHGRLANADHISIGFYLGVGRILSKYS